MRWRIWLFTLMIISALACPVAGQEKLRLATLEWAPYVGKNLENYGWTAEIIRQAFKRGGYDVTIDFMPWKRVLSSIKHNTYDGGFPAYRNAERAGYAYFSDPIGTSAIGFFKRSNKVVKYTHLRELITYKIGTLKGFVNTDEFDQADYLSKLEVLNENKSLGMLIKGRLDLSLMDRDVGNMLIAGKYKEFKHELEFMEPPLSVNLLYLIISKRNPRHKELMDAFNRGLKEMMDDGSISAIRKKYGVDR